MGGTEARSERDVCSIPAMPCGVGVPVVAMLAESVDCCVYCSKHNWIELSLRWWMRFHSGHASLTNRACGDKLEHTTLLPSTVAASPSLPIFSP
jgi:hypothetical protein